MKNLKAKQKIDTFLEIQYIEIILKGGSKFGIGCYDGTHSLLPCNFVPLPKRKRMALILLKGGEKEHIINYYTKYLDIFTSKYVTYYITSDQSMFRINTFISLICDRILIKKKDMRAIIYKNLISYIVQFFFFFFLYF